MPSRKQTRVKHVCSKHTIPRSIVDDMVKWPAQGQRAGDRRGKMGRWTMSRFIENACVVCVTNTKYWRVYSGVGLPFISKHRVVVLLNHLFLYYPIIDAESCASLARWIESRMMCMLLDISERCPDTFLRTSENEDTKRDLGCKEGERHVKLCVRHERYYSLRYLLRGGQRWLCFGHIPSP
jgi:hypothetical protein